MGTAALALSGGVAAAALIYYAVRRQRNSPTLATSEIPVFDLAHFLAGDADEATCKAMASYLRDTSILVVRDPRVTAEDAQRFTELMQRYYSQPVDSLMADARPECAYQVGVTPEKVECAKCAKDPACLERIEAMPEDQRPHKPTKADPKWRFFWRIGPRPEASSFPEQNLEPVCPKAFPEWTPTMDAWGAQMLAALETSAEMLALGFGLPKGALRELMHLGPHLLAPTGSDLAQYDHPHTLALALVLALALTLHPHPRHRHRPSPFTPAVAVALAPTQVPPIGDHICGVAHRPQLPDDPREEQLSRPLRVAARRLQDGRPGASGLPADSGRPANGVRDGRTCDRRLSRGGGRRRCDVCRSARTG